MQEYFHKGLESDIIEALIDKDGFITDVHLTDYPFTLTRVSIDKLNEDKFNEIFFKVRNYTNDEYSIWSGAIETEEGWDNYIFAYKKDDDYERNIKDNMIRNLIKNRFD